MKFSNIKLKIIRINKNRKMLLQGTKYKVLSNEKYLPIFT